MYPPPLVRGEETLARGRGEWGVNILEDVRHGSVLYVCKYFVVLTYPNITSAPGSGRIVQERVVLRIKKTGIGNPRHNGEGHIDQGHIDQGHIVTSTYGHEHGQHMR